MSSRGRYNKVTKRGILPLCDCKIPKASSLVGLHMTEQVDDICINCGHYVYWGTSEDIVDLHAINSNRCQYTEDDINNAELLYYKCGNLSQVARDTNISRLTLHKWKHVYNWKGK